jgi:hypothetical protein
VQRAYIAGLGGIAAIAAEQEKNLLPSKQARSR